MTHEYELELELENTWERFDPDFSDDEYPTVDRERESAKFGDEVTAGHPEAYARGPFVPTYGEIATLTIIVVSMFIFAMGVK